MVISRLLQSSVLTCLLFLSFVTSAQIVVESDYVYEGTCFSYVVPKGYEQVEYYAEPVFVFLPDTNGFNKFLNSSDGDIPFDKGIVTGYVPREELDGLALFEFVEGLGVVMESMPEVSLRKGPFKNADGSIPFAQAQFHYLSEEFEIDNICLKAFEFGEYFFWFASFNLSLDERSEMMLVSETINSSIVFFETEKQNSLKTPLDFANYSRNGGVETNIDYNDILFKKESSSYWSEFDDGSYLSYHDYGAPNASIQGAVFTFSAGVDSDQLSTPELVELVSDNQKGLGVTDLVFEGVVKGDEFEFRKYKVEGSSKARSTLKNVYTTIFDGELLVFIVKRSDQMTANFTKYYEAFIKSLYHR